MNLRTQEGLREIGNSSFGAQTQKDKELGGGCPSGLPGYAKDTLPQAAALNMKSRVCWDFKIVPR